MTKGKGKAREVGMKEDEKPKKGRPRHDPNNITFGHYKGKPAMIARWPKKKGEDPGEDSGPSPQDLPDPEQPPILGGPGIGPGSGDESDDDPAGPGQRGGGISDDELDDPGIRPDGPDDRPHQIFRTRGRARRMGFVIPGRRRRYDESESSSSCESYGSAYYDYSSESDWY